MKDRIQILENRKAKVSKIALTSDLPIDYRKRALRLVQRINKELQVENKLYATLVYLKNTHLDK